MKGPVYVRELSRYSADSLAKKMQLDSDAVQGLIRALAVAGVLSAPLSSLNGDDEVIDTAPVDLRERDCFQFTWVGIAIFRDRPIVVYPKYINKGANYFLSEDGRAEIQQVLRVVRKGTNGPSVFHELDDDSVSASGMLALMLALIDSFSENGIYSNYLRVSKTNGNGAIDWGANYLQISALPFERSPRLLRVRDRGDLPRRCGLRNKASSLRSNPVLQVPD